MYVRSGVIIHSYTQLGLLLTWLPPTYHTKKAKTPYNKKVLLKYKK